MKQTERKLPRLKDFDYSQKGCYFVTICTHNRLHLFGFIQESKMILNEYGRIATDMLLMIPKHYEAVELDRYIIMPNHIHMLLTISERSRPFPTVSKIVGLYKSGVTRLIHKQNNQIKVWQTSYYDHVVRNDLDYYETAKYIKNNPVKWELDKYHTT